jgi:superfamily II DNA/RNA helicase
VQRELSALIDRRGGSVLAVYGGVGYGPQRRSLAQGVSAVVACPGRLEDLVASGDVVLDRVDLVVIDEADRMADMGFLPAVRRLLDLTPGRRQTLLFSATLDGDVDTLVRHYQRDPVRHEVARSDDDCPEVDHLFWRTTAEQRLALTADIVARTGSTIVFTRTRHGADRLAHRLGEAGVKAVAIHGGRSQGQRDRALRAFSSGRVPALVATDVAARGIHVDGVACVVHFDIPDDPKDYVHRSGRTGRAGTTGVVVSLVAGDGQRAGRALLRQLGRAERIEDVALDRLGAAPVPPERRPKRAREPVAERMAEPARAADRHQRPGRSRRPDRGTRAGRGGRPARHPERPHGRRARLTTEPSTETPRTESST